MRCMGQTLDDSDALPDRGSRSRKHAQSCGLVETSAVVESCCDLGAVASSAVVESRGDLEEVASSAEAGSW